MRKRYIVSLVVLAILIMVIGVLLAISLLNFPNKNLSNSKEDNNPINDNHNKIENIEITEEISKEIDTLIYNQLYILWDKNSLDEITNKEKVSVAFDVYSLNNNYESYGSIDANMLSEELIENSFSNSIYEGTLEHEDLLVHFYQLFINDYEAFIYDMEQKSYIKQAIGCDYGVIKPSAKKIYAFYKENNKYILKIKYIWGSQYDISPITSIYSSYEDAFNKTNLIFETIFDFDKQEVIKSSSEYIQENSDYLYSITQMHNYVFEYKDGMYKLVDFYRS